MTAQTETRSTVLDALAVLMACDRGDFASADAMWASYTETADTHSLASAIAAVALCAVRYAAVTSGQTPDRLLAGVAQEIREV